MSERKPFGKFKVLRGRHNEGGVTYQARTDNDVVESLTDLRKFNSQGSIKFGVLEIYGNGTEDSANVEQTAPTSRPAETESTVVKDLTREELNAMSVNELKQLCEDEEVSVPSSALKRELVDALLGAHV